MKKKHSVSKMERVQWLLKNRILWECLPYKEANFRMTHWNHLEKVFNQMRDEGLYGKTMTWTGSRLFKVMTAARSIWNTINMEVTYAKIDSSYQ